MKNGLNGENYSASGQCITFDDIASDYSDVLSRLASKAGCSLSYFSEYKILDLFQEFKNLNITKDKINILNYGCGIGLSDIYLGEKFPGAKIFCCDISSKSIEIAASMNKDIKNKPVYAVCDGLTIPFEEKFDIIFLGHVLRHIPPQFRLQTLGMLKNSLSENGFIMIYEFNPLNPAAYYFYLKEDMRENKYVKIVPAKTAEKYLHETGFEKICIKYRFFVPPFMKKFLWLEKYFLHCPFGAFYYTVAQ